MDSFLQDVVEPSALCSEETPSVNSIQEDQSSAPQTEPARRPAAAISDSRPAPAAPKPGEADHRKLTYLAGCEIKPPSGRM